MDDRTKVSPETIRLARAASPKMRERDLATSLGVSEAALVAAWCGQGVRRIEPRLDEIFGRLGEAGEVMALTRNESAVHEKIGVYDRYIAGKHVSMMLGEQIDTRMFRSHWVHAFAVEREDGEAIRRSLQFFDAHGDAVHKVHARPDTDIDAWRALVDGLVSDNQSQTVAIEPVPALPATADGEVPVDELRRRWSGMTDTHQFVRILRKLNVSRHAALRSVGDDFAWEVAPGAVGSMLESAAAGAVEIMCFVRSRGCIQIHAGTVANLKTMGPWLNVMDPTFHLHLRTDHIAETWAVRKPTDKGHVTSLEAVDGDGNLVIQFFGKRKEGVAERSEWRAIVEDLPRIPGSRAA